MVAQIQFIQSAHGTPPATSSLKISSSLVAYIMHLITHSLRTKNQISILHKHIYVFTCGAYYFEHWIIKWRCTKHLTKDKNRIHQKLWSCNTDSRIDWLPSSGYRRTNCVVRKTVCSWENVTKLLDKAPNNTKSVMEQSSEDIIWKAHIVLAL